MKEWERDEATDLLAEPEDLWLERFDRDGGTDLLEENFAEEEQATDLLQEETPSWSDSVGMPVKIDGDSQLGTTLLAEESNFFASFHRLATHEDIVMNKLVFRFGKDASSDYCLSDNPAISRNHADIIAKGGRFYIKDLHSSNHTYVNDQQIPEGQEWEIHDGDNFRLGDEEFVVEL